MAETVAVIHRVLASGSSFPSVVESATGRRYVMKLSGARPGRRALATEFVALKIARHLGLTVPDAQVLDLPRDFPWQAGTDEFYEAVLRGAGANLGVAFIPDAHDLKPPDLAELPELFVNRLAASTPCCRTSIAPPPIRISCATQPVCTGHRFRSLPAV